MAITTAALQKNRTQAVRGVSSPAVTRAASGSRDSARSFALPSATARAVGRLGLRAAAKGNEDGEAASIAFDRSFAPQQTAAREFRDALSRYLKLNAVEGSASCKIVLCAQEALINAIEHASEDALPVAVSARIGRDVFSLEVRDRGRGFDPGALDLGSPPDPLRERGRGLFLIRHLMDDVEITSSSYGTTIRMTLCLRGRVTATPN